MTGRDKVVAGCSAATVEVAGMVGAASAEVGMPAAEKAAVWTAGGVTAPRAEQVVLEVAAKAMVKQEEQVEWTERQEAVEALEEALVAQSHQRTRSASRATRSRPACRPEPTLCPTAAVGGGPGLPALGTPARRRGHA